MEVGESNLLLWAYGGFMKDEVGESVLIERSR